MKMLLVILLTLAGISGGNLRAESPLATFLEIYHSDPTVTGGKEFKRWLAKREEELNAGSRIALTAAGPIEYRKKGSGPVVICLHGAFGGYDASFLLGEPLLRQFTVIAVSRPGYLRTPLSVGSSPEEQADAMIALMDSLKIKKAAVLGFSAGSLTAFQMAARYPNRIWACVMQGVGARPADLKSGGAYDVLRALVQDDKLTTAFDIATWGLFDLARLDIRLTGEYLLQADVLDSMPQSKLRRRIRYVNGHRQQRSYLQRFVYSTTPYSLRRQGELNDLKDNLAIDPWQRWVNAGLPQSVQVPCQIIQGMWDSGGNYEEAKKLIAPNIPHCQLVAVQGCGHFLWLGRHTNVWEKKMGAFLRSHMHDELPLGRGSRN